MVRHYLLRIFLFYFLAGVTVQGFVGELEFEKGLTVHRRKRLREGLGLTTKLGHYSDELGREDQMGDGELGVSKGGVGE